MRAAMHDSGPLLTVLEVVTSTYLFVALVALASPTEWLPSLYGLENPGRVRAFSLFHSH